MKNTSNIGLLIHEALKKIYPQINGGYTFRIGEEDFDNALFWENQEYPKPTWEQIEAVLPIVELEEAKEKKHQEIAEFYINANLQDKIHEAKIIQGKGIGTIRQFKFKQKYDNKIPALDTDRFLNICIISDKPLPYETEAAEGDKIIVQITPAKAKEILNHMIERYTINYAISSFLRMKIENCKTINEVEKISWNPSVITKDQLMQAQKTLYN